jgi:hypothetical protein
MLRAGNVLPLVLAIAAGTSLCPAQSTGRTFYVDCGAAANGTGRSVRSPWNGLAPVNAGLFQPGDTIALRRGTTCDGALAPQGSGAADRPIRLTAWGTGSRPKVIAPRSADAALRLFNQEYWDIDSLDFSGASTWGVYISGDRGVLHSIHLADLAVHDVMGGTMRHKESGLIAITPSSANSHFDGVLVDGVTAWNTNQWVGILIGGGDLGYPPESDWTENAEIRNSTVHDVQGDGIVLFRVRHGRIDSSVAWNTGMQDTQTIGTPNAIWTWMCDDCTVENNEAYLTDSPGVDGGAYDIDYGNTKNSVIDNYAHDTQGYCIAVFGAGFITRQSVVRGNLCINNGRSPRMAKYQGSMFLLTWNGGSIDGLTMENNTVYWNPFENAPALLSNADIAPGTAVFRNNAIHSTAAWMVSSDSSMTLTQNTYDYYSDLAGKQLPEWRIGKTGFHSLSAMEAATHETNAGGYARHTLANWPLAERWQARDSGVRPAAPGSPRNAWSLRCDLPVTLDAHGWIDAAALRQIVVLRSFAQQYRALGLRVTLNLTAPDAAVFSRPGFRNDLADLALQGVTVRMLNSGKTDATTLTAPGGKVVDHWQGFAGPVQLGLALRKALGQPLYAQMRAATDE